MEEAEVATSELRHASGSNGRSSECSTMGRGGQGGDKDEEHKHGTFPSRQLDRNGARQVWCGRQQSPPHPRPLLR